MTRDSTRQLSPSFRVREFACKGSDAVLIDDELVVLLQCIREHFGKPVHITSGYRTAEHNAAVGGQVEPAPAGPGGILLRRRCAGGDCRRLCRDSASRAWRHRTVSEGYKASRPQDRLGAYRYSGGQEPVEYVRG